MVLLGSVTGVDGRQYDAASRGDCIPRIRGSERARSGPLAVRVEQLNGLRVVRIRMTSVCSLPLTISLGAAVCCCHRTLPVRLSMPSRRLYMPLLGLVTLQTKGTTLRWPGRAYAVITSPSGQDLGVFAVHRLRPSRSAKARTAPGASVRAWPPSERRGPMALGMLDVYVPQRLARAQIDADEPPVAEGGHHGAFRHVERIHTGLRVWALVAPVLLAGPHVHRSHAGERTCLPYVQSVDQGFIESRSPTYDAFRRDRGPGAERGGKGAAGSSDHVPWLVPVHPQVAHREEEQRDKQTPHLTAGQRPHFRNVRNRLARSPRQPHSWFSQQIHPSRHNSPPALPLITVTRWLRDSHLPQKGSTRAAVWLPWLARWFPRAAVHFPGLLPGLRSESEGHGPPQFPSHSLPFGVVRTGTTGPIGHR